MAEGCSEQSVELRWSQHLGGSRAGSCQPQLFLLSVCTGISAREWFSSTVRDRQTFTSLLSASGIVLQLFTEPLLLRGQQM